MSSKNTIQIRLRESGQAYFCLPSKIFPKPGDCVIVKLERGLEYGHVLAESGICCTQKSSDGIKEIVRIATADDLKRIEENKQKSQAAFESCQNKIKEHRLNMKLVDTEYMFDRSKIIFYFTAEGRIDFRKLLKDLAKIFKTRIELRQIGVRDEAKLFGGIGPCGKKLCCASFLKDFDPVTIKMAKEQGLPLNPPKISGICGRLMCCLSYEYPTYKALSKEMPREGEKITTAQGKGKVIGINVLKHTIMVELANGNQVEIKYKKSNS